MDANRILVTGAGGFIGSALAKQILSAPPHELLLLDHSEHALHQLELSLSAVEGPQRHRLVPGDVGDLPLISSLLKEYRPDLILHAAAYKHVPLMEAHPFAALQNNAIFTWQLAKAAAEACVPRLLLISTDKAANPRSILGVSKRIAERAVLCWNGPARQYAAIRLVNVLGSTGSVVPLFQEQIARGGPLTVTHPDATRYFLTLPHTVQAILLAAAQPGGVVYLPQLPEPVRILNLAKRMIRDSCAGSGSEITIRFTGLRPGDKLTEEVVSSDESLQATTVPAIQAAVGRSIEVNEFDRGIERLNESIQRRDLPALLEMLCELVPEYQPSAALCATEHHS
jgi:FlaA1/EpsC-like NDP-sugar epimerase